MIDHEGTGNAKVADEPGKVYVRLDRGLSGEASGELIKAWGRIRPVPRWAVFVGTTPYRDWEYTVLEVDRDAMGGELNAEASLEPHAPTHEWAHPSGSDDVVRPRFLQLYDFSVWPATGTSVQVMSGAYSPSGTARELEVSDVELAGWKPAWGQRYISICLSPTGTFELVPGTIRTFLTIDDVPPAPSTDHWRLAAVRLRASDTQIVQSPYDTNILDLRLSGIGWPTKKPRIHIEDADGTLADVTAKFNALLAELEALGLMSQE
jgi:hypothetical protein